MKAVIAIDPGTSESALVVWAGNILEAEFMTNERLLGKARDTFVSLPRFPVAIEMVACYGMPVGKEVFETCLMIGRLLEAFESHGFNCTLVYRKDVKLHLCGTVKAKDENISRALKDKHGEVGTKLHPGPLYGIKGHLWAALAVADYALTHDK